MVAVVAVVVVAMREGCAASTAFAFWSYVWMQKDLTYIATVNIMTTLFATGHLAYSESRARLHDLYGVLKKGVVDSAIQTLEKILEERK